MDNLSKLQSKVNSLEHAVDKVTKSVSECENSSDKASLKNLKKVQTVSSSPKHSALTPRLPVDDIYKQQSPSSSKSMEMLGDNLSTNCRSSTSFRDGLDVFKHSTLEAIRNPIAKCTPNNSARSPRSVRSQERDANARISNLEGVTGFWKGVKEFLSVGNLESAYVEAMLSGDRLSLVQLMDRTGPILDRLSHETASEVLNVIAANFIDQRSLDSAVPWLQQVSYWYFYNSVTLCLSKHINFRPF